MNQPTTPKTQQTLVKFVLFWQKWHSVESVVCPTETDLLSIHIYGYHNLYCIFSYLGTNLWWSWICKEIQGKSIQYFSSPGEASANTGYKSTVTVDSMSVWQNVSEAYSPVQ